MILSRAHLGLGVLLLLLASSEVQGGGSISKSPGNKVDKAKIQMLSAYAPIMEPSSSSDTGLVQIKVDENGECKIGEPDENEEYCIGKVHPLVTVYMEEDTNNALASDIRASDIHAAVSLDEGATWKRANLSNSAGKNRTHSGGHCFTVHGHGDGDDDGNHDQRLLDGDGDGDGDGITDQFDYPGDTFKPMVVAKGKDILVAWTSKDCKGGVPDGGAQDGGLPFEEDDKYQVNGRHNCHDYEGEGVGKGKVPFSCVWAARGVVNTNTGETIWRKPERITSGRRDAFQLVAQATGSGPKGAWALAWQEDPKGLRPGEAAGPGSGMSGATVNHKTDIWYSYLSGKDFGENVEDEGSNKPSVTKRFSPPVRITDNAVCKYETNENGALVYENGKPVMKGGPYCKDICNISDTYFDDERPENGQSCKTAEGVILNGDTGASRVNMMLVPDNNSARVLLAYEETKGLGHGGDKNSEQDREDWGKNIYYHTFMYDHPETETIAHGIMLNLPETDKSGKPLVSLDKLDFLTQNARRVKLIVQPLANVGQEQTTVVAIWREGPEGHGQPADIMMRRFRGGYEPENLICTGTRKHPKTRKSVCVRGAVNLNEDQPPFDEESQRNSRAHRGFIRGDFLVIGYTHTSKWNRDPDTGKPYDFFVRRSFNGGTFFGNKHGQKEAAKNLSEVRTQGNGGWSTMEPRLVPTPSTWGGVSPKSKSDVQNQMVFFVSYCTTHNPHRQGGDGRFLEGLPTGTDVPKDIFWTYTDNSGETYYKQLNTNSSKWEYPWVAKTSGSKDDPYDEQFGAPQMRATPAGDKVFISFEGYVAGTAGDGSGPCKGNGQAGSDVCFDSEAGMDHFEPYDFNDDGVVDKKDWLLLSRASEAYEVDPEFDLNDDGVIDGFDKLLFNAARNEYDKAVGLVQSRRHAYLRGL